jgi:hypothetical protein
MVTLDDIRTVALSLPRTEEALVRDQVKFRVGRIVYVALSRDELWMGFGFPKDERAVLVAADPKKFFMPIPSDLRYNWVRVGAAGDRSDRDAGARRRRVAHGRAEASCRRVSR